MNRENKVDNNSQRAIQFIMNTGGFKDVCEPLFFASKTQDYRLSYGVAEGSEVLEITVIRRNFIFHIEVERGCGSKITLRNGTFFGNKKIPTYTDITPFFRDIHHPTKEEIQLACVIEPFICGCIAQVGKDLLNHLGGQ